MENRLRVLLVEDNEDDYILIRELLSETGHAQHDLTWVTAYEAALETLACGEVDVALVDYRLGARDGLDLVRETVAGGCKTPFIMLTGQGSYELDVAAMEAGAADYLVKGQVDAHLLERSIRYAIEHRRAQTMLAKRAKESTCLYAVYREIQEQLSIDELCRRVMEHLSQAMQHPEIAVPVIKLDDRRFTSKTYTEGLLHGLHGEIRVRGEAHGHLWIYYAEDRPFLIPEEQNLINAVAEALGMWFQRKQAEEELRESEERYRGLFEDMPVGLYRATPEGQILDVNPALVTMLGYPDRQTLMARNVASGCEDTEERRLWQSLIEHAGEVRGYETERRRYDGTPIWVRESTRAIRDDDGQVFYYEGAVEDITERKEIEDALRESEQRFKLLYLAMDEGLCLCSVIYDESGQAIDFQIIDVNLAYESITGIEREKAVGKTASELYGTGQPPYLEIYAKVADTGEPMSFETYFPPTEKHLRVSVFSPGEGRFATLFADITKRKRAEEALQRHAERLRTLHALDGAILAAWSAEEIAQAALRHIQRLVPCWQCSVVMFDPEGQEATVLATHMDGQNRIGAETRYLPEAATMEELRQGNVHVVEDILSLSQPSPMIQALYAKGLRSHITVPLINQSQPIGSLNLGSESPSAFAPEHVDIAREIGDQIAVALHQARLREQVERHVVELEQHVAERTADLRAANAELARAARLKDEFLAAMSHELRTPLNAILGLSEALQEEVYGPLTERQIKSLHTIETSGRHLLSLISDILDVSKIGAGKLELTIGPVSVESVCRASLGLIKQIAHKKRLKVSLSLDNEVTTIQADMRRLKQILVNLLTNAVKFTPEGGAIGLEVVKDVERQVVHFTVWDTGIGISPEEMGRLFKPFVQLDSSLARQHTGTGLGLALVHRLTEMHGGGVSVESEPGRGSRFTVSLPWQRSTHDKAIQEEADTPDEVRFEQVRGQEAAPLLSGQPLILLAEDNEMAISIISDYLLVMGYRLVVARNGAEALERVVEEQPDLIIMDIQMPGMDGLEATRRIRANPEQSVATIPIIALTALAMPGDRERCLEAGANGYSSKPVSLKGLVHMIEAQMAQKEAT